ncbi:PAS domain S-box protein [Desulfurispira natronophila]|uniref:histidine kinase n=1 Tax=Desulfurispira natronophila TaxID=682562 RepID=A0A7W8DGP9_9BACT|nr:PAS domain S-box protein [Desulfurispira natronophila]MBB5021599.1 PAS domain S-box-containing protein [Desulfurispira natronophila]
MKFLQNWSQREPLLILIIFTLLVGLLTTWQTLHHARQVQTDELQRQSRLLAQALNPEFLNHLQGTSDDAESHTWSRLASQLEASADLFPLAHTITVLRQDGTNQVRILLDISINAQSNRPPGTILPPEVVDPYIAYLQTGSEYVMGPFFHEDRDWIAVVVPIRQFGNQDHQNWLAIKFDAQRWTGQAWLQARVPLGVTLGLTILLLLVKVISAAGYGGRSSSTLRHSEALIVATAGTILTLAIAWITHGGETSRLQNSFAHMAKAESTGMAMTFNSIRDVNLEGLVRFMETNPNVNRQEFKDYTATLVAIPSINAISWSPQVTRSKRASFEQTMTLEHDFPEFMIWERDETGEVIRAQQRERYFPIRFRSPLEGNEHVLGFDIFSEPLRRSAMEYTLASGLPTASEPTILQLDDASRHGLLIYQPVFSYGESKRLQGFLTTVLPLSDLLHSTTGTNWSAQDDLMHLELWQLHPQREHMLLASSQSDGSALPKSHMSITRPIFAFGHTLALTMQPTENFYAMNPLRTGTISVVAGLLSTMALSLFVASLAHRRRELEKLVTERTSALQRSTQHLSATLRSIGDGVISTDINGQVTGVNLVAQELTGWQEHEALGRPITEVFRIENSVTREAALAPVAKTLREGATQGLANHTVLVSRNGLEYQIADSCAPIRDMQNQVSGAVMVFRDVTEEYRSRQQLAESEERLRAITDSANDAIVMMDDTGCITFWNPFARKLFGYSADEALGHRLHDLLAPPKYREHFTRALPHFRETGTGKNIGKMVELETLNRDGETIQIALSLSAIRIQGRWHAIGILRDITERKRYEWELREEVEKRVEQVREQDIIIYEQRRKQSLLHLLINLAHQWRQPLNVVGLLAQQIEDELVLEPLQKKFVQQWVGGIMEQLDELSLTIDRFTSLHDASENPAPYSLQQLCTEAFDIMQHHLKGRDITVQAEVPADLTLNTIKSDLVEILLKMLENVATIVDERHLSGAHITISARKVDDTVEMTVEDTAGGIDNQILPQVFEPYVTTAFKSRDKGLGLYLVRRIVEDRHQGTVRAENTDQGARFVMELRDTPAAFDLLPGDSR